MKFLKRNIYSILIIILCIIFVPNAISLQSQGHTQAIVTAIGIDKGEDAYEVSLQTIVPTPAEQFEQKISVVSGEGKSISEAFNNIALRLGKNIGIAQCRIIVISRNVDDDLASVFDSITKTKINTHNLSIIVTDTKAKEFINASENLDNNLYFALSDESYNNKHIDAVYLSLGDFYDDYLSKDQCSLITRINLSSSKDIGSIESQNTQDSSGGEKEQGSNQEDTVFNNGQSTVIKNGKFYFDLTPEQTRAFNWMRKESNKGYIYVSNVTDELYENADVGLEIEDKHLQKKVSFANGKPTITFKLTLYVRIDEIVSNKLSKKTLKSEKNFLTDKLKMLTIKQIKEEMAMAIKISKEYNFDAVKIKSQFTKYCNKDFVTYMYANNEKNYLNRINYVFDVDIKERM